MAKKKAKKKTETTTKRFVLSGKAAARLNRYLAEIRKGIISVCEMHTYDTAPSMSQSDFEVAYIDKILGQTATVVSISMKKMTEGLAEQKEKEAQAISGNSQLSKEDNTL